MATSCVAEEKATSNPHRARVSGAERGSTAAIRYRPVAMPAWASRIQLRRLPNSRFSTGSFSRSTTGAQNTLME